MYERIAEAAIERYKIEHPFRLLYRKQFPNKKEPKSFGPLVARLIEAGIVDKWPKRCLRRYEKLSNILHGR